MSLASAFFPPRRLSGEFDNFVFLTEETETEGKTDS